jgi:hypothetical protein
MKRIRLVVSASALLIAGAACPALAANANAAGTQVNPSQLCTANDNSVYVSGFGFDLPIPSHGGCTSTVAAHGDATGAVAPGEYSHAAFVAQCKLLQSELPPELWNAPVVIVPGPDGIPENIGGFGGNIETCTWLLQGYHSGTLTHPE